MTERLRERSLWGANQQIQARGNNKAQSTRCQITEGGTTHHDSVNT